MHGTVTARASGLKRGLNSGLNPLLEFLFGHGAVPVLIRLCMTLLAFLGNFVSRYLPILILVESAKKHPRIGSPRLAAGSCGAGSLPAGMGLHGGAELLGRQLLVLVAVGPNQHLFQVLGGLVGDLVGGNRAVVVGVEPLEHGLGAGPLGPLAFLGRNELDSDAATLVTADKAYTQNGGSFRALVISLLTSDSFLYRKTIKQGQ